MVFLQHKLSVKLSQRQILTPGLVQMVSVLALNKLELKDMINAEMVENPVLEELEDSVPLLDEVGKKEEDRERAAATNEENPITAVEKKDPFEEIDFGSFFQDYLDPGYRTHSEMEDIERPSFENFLSKPTNLTDHLAWQLGALSLRREVREAADLIIGNLNEDGYLIASDDELLGVAPRLRPKPTPRPRRKYCERSPGPGPGWKCRRTEPERTETGNCRCVPPRTSLNSASSATWKYSRRRRPLLGSTQELCTPAEAHSNHHPLDLLHTERTPAPRPSPRPQSPSRTRRPRLLRSPHSRRSPPRICRKLWKSCVNWILPAWPAAICANACSTSSATTRRSSRLHKNGNGTAQVLQDAMAIVDQHLRGLQNKQHKEIAKAIGRPIEAVQQALDYIRTLDPRPGLRYNKVQPRLIEPDVAFVKHGDEWLVIMNDEDLPQLRLNPAYKKLVTRDGTNEKSTRDYVKERYKSAIQLIKNIEQRKQTITKVCYCIVARQQDFLERGIDQLKPMMIKEVAEEIGVHPSTVSRAVANKYAHTPQGVFELRYFFSESVQGPEGGGTSLLILKRRVKKLIEEEDPSRPLTDEQITRILQSQGIQVTRRTVAKYREDMRIPSTHQRRVKIIDAGATLQPGKAIEGGLPAGR